MFARSYTKGGHDFLEVILKAATFLSDACQPEVSVTAKIGTLSKDVFERRMSTGSEAFSLFICLDANKLVLLSFFSLLKTIYPRVSTKPLPNDAKSPLPVDVRRSKTLLLKLPNDRFDFSCFMLVLCDLLVERFHSVN